MNKARIAVNTGELERQSAAKTLLREVETAYLDAVSAQSQYLAAAEKLRYARTSYELTGEQFRLGMKNTVELITAQNEYTSARQELLQAKYMALLNIELLNIYPVSYTHLDVYKRQGTARVAKYSAIRSARFVRS